MSDSWDSIFKKQVSLPEAPRLKHQKRETKDALGSVRNDNSEPINLSFLFDRPLEANAPKPPSPSSIQGDSLSSKPDPLSYSNEFSEDCPRQPNDKDWKRENTKLSEIQWAHAKRRFFQDSASTNQGGSRSSNHTETSPHRTLTGSNLGHARPQIGGNKALANMYRRIQNRKHLEHQNMPSTKVYSEGEYYRKETEGITNGQKGQAEDGLGFKKLALKQAVSSPGLKDDANGYQSSYDRDHFIPRPPSKQQQPPSPRPSNSRFHFESVDSLSRRPHDGSLTPVRNLESFATSQPDRSSNPENIRQAGYYPANHPNYSQDAYQSQRSSLLHAKASRPSHANSEGDRFSEPIRARGQESPYLSSAPDRQSQYFSRKHATEKLRAAQNNWRQNAQSRFQAANQPQAWGKSQNSGVYAPVYDEFKPEYCEPWDHTPPSRPNSMDDAPYQYRTQHPMDRDQDYATQNGFQPNLFHSPSHQGRFYQPPDLQSRLKPLDLRQQQAPLNRAAFRHVDTNNLRGYMDQPLSYPEPVAEHLPQDHNLRESWIIEGIKELVAAEPVKYEVLEQVVANGPISEGTLLRKIKKSGRYMGQVALGLILFHLIEDYGNEMITRKFEDGMYTYSTSDEFKAIFKRAIATS